MVHLTDKATYSVASRLVLNLDISKSAIESLEVKHFDTFAAAAGYASALTGTRFINVKFSNGDETSSISGSLYCYSKDNTRRPCNEYLIKQVTLRGGK